MVFAIANFFNQNLQDLAEEREEGWDALEWSEQCFFISIIYASVKAQV